MNGVASPVQMPQVVRRGPARRLPVSRISLSSASSTHSDESDDAVRPHEQKTLLRSVRQPSIHTETLQLRKTASGELSPVKTMLEFIPRNSRGSLSSGSPPSSLSGSPPLSPTSSNNTGPSADSCYSLPSVQKLQLKSSKNVVPNYKQLLDLSTTRKVYSDYGSIASTYGSDSGEDKTPAACRRLFSGRDVNAPKETLALRPATTSFVGTSIDDFCSFCYNMEVHAAMNKSLPMPKVAERGPWRGHPTRENGSIVCSRLLRQVCSACGATGQDAHESQRCSKNSRMLNYF